MREKTIYVANDGKAFATKDECMNYEIKAIDTEKLIDVAKVIYDICNMFDDCGKCPLKKSIGSTCRFNCSRFTVPPCEAWDFDDMK